MSCYDGLIIYWDVSGVGMGAIVPGMEPQAVNEGAALCWHHERTEYGRRRSFLLLLQQNTTAWWLQTTRFFFFTVLAGRIPKRVSIGDKAAVHRLGSF